MRLLSIGNIFLAVILFLGCLSEMKRFKVLPHPHWIFEFLEDMMLGWVVSQGAEVKFSCVMSLQISKVNFHEFIGENFYEFIIIFLHHNVFLKCLKNNYIFLTFFILKTSLWWVSKNLTELRCAVKLAVSRHSEIWRHSFHQDFTKGVKSWQRLDSIIQVISCKFEFPQHSHSNDFRKEWKFVLNLFFVLFFEFRQLLKTAWSVFIVPALFRTSMLEIMLGKSMQSGVRHVLFSCCSKERDLFRMCRNQWRRVIL